jgi:dipeptidyl aminopeptidase/acylaminoacyl peptidase
MHRVFGLMVLSALAALAQNLPFTVEAMMKLARISDPRVSPDGKMVTFTAQTIDVPNNTRPKQIYIVPLEGGPPRRITFEGDNERARWTPDSRRIVFVSTRGGSSQIWAMNPDGSGAQQLTNIATEATGVLVSPDGRKLVFQSDVYPECSVNSKFDDNCNRRKLEEEKANKVQARIYTSLLYRHWTDWKSSRRRHLLSMDIAGGPISDLTPGDLPVPPFSLGGPEGYAIAPDSAEVAYVMNSDPVPATSTNTDIYVVPIGGGESRKITSNPGADSGPTYSPDGKFLAYRSQARAGYESDRWRLIVLERATGALRELTETLDRSVESITWSPDSTRVFFTAIDRGRTPLQMVSAAGGGLRSIISGPSSVDDVQFTADGKTVVYTEQRGNRPTEIYRASSGGGAPVPLTRLNDGLLANYWLPPLEEFWVEGAEGARIHSFLAKPPGFRPDRKHPVLFLIHGGPQGEWGESWSYRWNAQVFASAGYVVVMPNPRGSIGYGQKFTDEINADWGGKVFDDIMAVVDHVATQPYADPARMAAAGGSYGGYMVDWMLGHTDRFKAFVTHAGVFDLRSMAGETEELWFPLWEFKGMPWQNPDVYAKWSPSYYVDKFKTPTLVIHGERDYRVPYGQGLQAFTALQMQKVPSKLLIFPDEGHWILKPQNSILWYHTFLDWIGEWTARRAPSSAAPAPAAAETPPKTTPAR